MSPEAATVRVNWSEVAGSGANGSAPGAPVVMVTAVAGSGGSSTVAAPPSCTHAAAAAHRSPVGSTNLTRWPAGQFTPIWDRGRQVSERSKIRNRRRLRLRRRRLNCRHISRVGIIIVVVFDFICFLSFPFRQIIIRRKKSHGIKFVVLIREVFFFFFVQCTQTFLFSSDLCFFRRRTDRKNSR
jgi:hypothetical protein